MSRVRLNIKSTKSVEEARILAARCNHLVKTLRRVARESRVESLRPVQLQSQFAGADSAIALQFRVEIRRFLLRDRPNRRTVLSFFHEDRLCQSDSRVP